MNWQPIETAPKTPDQYGMTPFVILGYAPDEEDYTLPSREGFWNTTEQRWCSTLDPCFEGATPTHWMPMPDPPTKDQS